MERLLVIASFFPLGDATGAPLSLSCAGPSTRIAVEWSCPDGFTSPHLSVSLCHQPPFRRPIVGFTKLHGVSGAASPPTWPLLFSGANTPIPNISREAAPAINNTGASKTDSQAREDDDASSASVADRRSRGNGAIATLPPFLCGGRDMTGSAAMTVTKQAYALQLPRAEIPAVYTRTVRVDGTKLPRTLHAAMWWLRRNASVPLVLNSPFMRGRLSVYPPLTDAQRTALMLPQFTDDKNQIHILTHNAELRARFAAFADPVLPFLVDVQLPECRRAVDLSPLSGAVNMICFCVSGDGVHSVDFLGNCESLEYIDIVRCPNVTDLSPLTVTETKAQRVSAILAAATGIVDTAHFLTARCTALEHLDLSHCASLSEFASIGTLKSLRQLNLSHTRVNSLTWIGGCAQLETLHVIECTQLSDLSPLANITYLETLNASESGVKSLDWLARHCRFLYRLDLDNCKSIVDWAPIGEAIGSGSLGFLSVAGCGPFGDLEWLRSRYNQRAQEGLRSRLRVLNVSNCNQLSDASTLTGATALTSLNISATAVRDFSWLPTCTALEDLNMSKCPHVHNFVPIYAVAAHLLSLNLSWCTMTNPRAELLANPLATTDTDPFSSLGEAEDGLDGGSPNPQLLHEHTLRTSPTLYQLLDLDLSNCKKLTNLFAIVAATGSTLRRLTVAASSVDTVQWLASCTALRVLHMPHCGRLPQDQPLDLSPLRASASTLVELNVSYTIAVSDLSVLALCTSLERLNVAHCTRIADLEPLRRLGRLELVNLAGCVAVTSLDPLRGCTQLKQLNVSQCTGLTSFTAIGYLRELRRLDVSGTTLSSVAWITRCRALEEVNVARCSQLFDVAAFGKLPNLARLNLAHTGALLTLACSGVSAPAYAEPPTVASESGGHGTGRGGSDHQHDRDLASGAGRSSAGSACHLM